MRDAAFWNRAFRVAYRRVGGLHFLALGRLTVSWSVGNRRPEGE